MGWCPAAAAALTTVIVVCVYPSSAFLHVSSTSPRAATPATTGTAGASSSFGYGRRAIPTSRETFRRRASRRKEDLKRKSLSGEGGEADALLLRMDFEHGEVDEIRDWIRRFPFGTALPVQPFSLVETETGVDVEFRKKPTLERGGRDGGLRFTVEDTEAEDGVDIPPGPTLIMRRNAEGQEIRKMFAERIVVKAVVKSLAGGGAPPGVKVRTVLHEGLV